MIDSSSRPQLSRVGAAALVLGSLAALGVGAVWYAAAAPAVPITELELAGSTARAADIVGDRRDQFIRAVNADWALIAGYLGALLLAGRLGRCVFWTARARAAASVVLPASVAAATADGVENLLLRDALTMPAGDPQWVWAQAAAFTKFGLLALAAPVALAAVAFTAGRLARPDRTPFPAQDLRPAPPLEPPSGGPLAGPKDLTRAAVAPADARWAAAAALPPGRPPGRMGICASGGGIRSACVTLGALQALRESAVLDRADYLVSVSGGGYAAGAFQLALQPRPGAEADPNAAGPDTVLCQGSVEEDHVRRHGRYLADTAKEWAVALGGLARGLLLTLALVTLTVVVAGLALGLFYRWVPVAGLAATRRAIIEATDVEIPRPEAGVLLAIGLVAGAALLLHVLVVVALLRGSGGERWAAALGTAERVARALGGIAVLLAVLGIGVPTLVWAAAEVVDWLSGWLGGGPLGGGLGGGALTVAVTYLGMLVGLLWRSRRVIGSGAGRLRALFGGSGQRPRAAALPTGLVQRVIVLLSLALLVVALLLVLGLAVGVTDTWSIPLQLGIVAAFAAALLALDQTWLSLHPFYRERLASAFAVRRATGGDGRVVAAPYDFATEQTTLSEYGKAVPGFPKVIFAAAANLSGDDRTPPGRRAVSFTMADDWVGGPDIGWARTETLEERTQGQLRLDLTVQAAMAISGAAFASAMGRQARAYQTFFALSGARLGTWLPNPHFLSVARDGGWRTPGLPRLRRLPYLFREVLGTHPLDDRLLFCSDGGHYENLGLVELLRHRCRIVYCIDASGDAPPFATTLAEAVTLAYEELGVRIELDPSTDPHRDGVVTGRIRYPHPVDWEDGPGTEGTLVVAKATLAEDLPYELKAYAAANPVFPRDSTGDQWFDHGQFDAYQALGRHLGRRAATAGRLADLDLQQRRDREEQG